MILIGNYSEKTYLGYNIIKAFRSGNEKETIRMQYELVNKFPEGFCPVCNDYLLTVKI